MGFLKNQRKSTLVPLLLPALSCGSSVTVRLLRHLRFVVFLLGQFCWNTPFGWQSMNSISCTHGTLEYISTPKMFNVNHMFALSEYTTGS